MKRLIVIVIVVSIATSLLSAYEVNVPNEVPDYKDLQLILTIGEQDRPVEQARFYLLQEGSDTPVFSEFTLADDVWSTTISFVHLNGEELSYYVQIQDIDGKFHRLPEKDMLKARMLHDTSAPTLEMLSPEKPVLQKGKEQLVVFRIVEDSSVSDFSIQYNGVPIQKAAVYQDFLTFLINPEESVGESAVIDISLVDVSENKAEQSISFEIKKESGPFFSATADYVAEMGVEYTLDMGKSANTTNVGTMFGDLDHKVILNVKLGGETTVKAGPVALELSAGLGDSVSVFDILTCYPDTLIADYQNIMNLLHPWNFANEFDYSGEIPRPSYNINYFLSRFSLIAPIFSLAFGVQKITFHDRTVKEFGFRGQSLKIDVPFFTFSIGKGLADLGLYQAAWPKNFFGVNIGIDVLDYWYFQTNLSFISSLQGRYDRLVSTGTSAIGTLYDVGSVKPEENYVLGMETGVKTKIFTLSADMGLTLYVDDAGTIIDKTKLANDISSLVDISTYLGYVDKITTIFPLFDYFPLSDGIIVKAINMNLWGLTYGADLHLPLYGVEAWFHKTDKSYKSLGSSVTSDLMDWGTSWEGQLSEFNLEAGYNGTKDNIPDILFNDIIALVKPSLAPTAPPTEINISNIVHTGIVGIDTPVFDPIGSFSVDYTFEWATTKAEALAKKITNDDAAKNLILNSTKNDTNMTHTGELAYKSASYKIGDVKLSLGAKTKDAYVTKIEVDGVKNGATYWNFSYAVNTSVQVARYRFDVNFADQWSTDTGTDHSYKYGVKATISDMFFDTVTVSGTFNQIFNANALKEWDIEGGLTLDKRFGFLSMSTAFGVKYVESIVDNTKDALTSSLTVKGTIAF